MPDSFDWERAQALIDELSARLAARGVNINLYIVGGTAMAQRGADYRLRVTKDIDAIYTSSDDAAVRAEVLAMAQEYGMASTWFNAASKNYLPQGVGIHAAGVTYATDEELLAMKMAAHREQDIDDLSVLAHRLGLSQAREMVAIADRLWE